MQRVIPYKVFFSICWFLSDFPCISDLYVEYIVIDDFKIVPRKAIKLRILVDVCHFMQIRICLFWLSDNSHQYCTTSSMYICLYINHIVIRVWSHWSVVTSPAFELVFRDALVQFLWHLLTTTTKAAFHFWVKNWIVNLWYVAISVSQEHLTSWSDVFACMLDVYILAVCRLIRARELSSHVPLTFISVLVRRGCDKNSHQLNYYYIFRYRTWSSILHFKL